jgi:hypothetical protein
MVDLHMHSTASDGFLSPAALVRYAASLGISAMALTDHDTTAGIPEARAEAKKLGVRLIAGVELEADFDLGALHILGIGLAELGGALEEGLQLLRAERLRRNLGMLSRLGELGIDASYDELASYAAGGVVGRPHLAQLLVDRQAAASYQEAFDRYLADGAPAHEPRSAPSLSRCIELVHAAGGKAVVAHPRTLWLSSWRKITDAFARWKELGLDGIEAYHAGAPPALCERYAEISRRVGLIVTAGSDYHGRWGRPGRTSTGMDIADEFASPFLGHTPPAGPVGETFPLGTEAT